jgi:hypothetical protein
MHIPSQQLRPLPPPEVPTTPTQRGGPRSRPLLPRTHSPSTRAAGPVSRPPPPSPPPEASAAPCRPAPRPPPPRPSAAPPPCCCRAPPDRAAHSWPAISMLRGAMKAGPIATSRSASAAGPSAATCACVWGQGAGVVGGGRGAGRQEGGRGGEAAGHGAAAPHGRALCMERAQGTPRRAFHPLPSACRPPCTHAWRGSQRQQALCMQRPARQQQRALRMGAGAAAGLYGAAAAQAPTKCRLRPTPIFRTSPAVADAPSPRTSPATVEAPAALTTEAERAGPPAPATAAVRGAPMAATSWGVG